MSNTKLVVLSLALCLQASALTTNPSSNSYNDADECSSRMALCASFADGAQLLSAAHLAT